MRGIFLFACFGVGLSGCSSEAANAERELEIIQNSHGTNAELCAARRKVAAAYLKAQKQWEYRVADSAAAITCQSADMAPNERPGIPEAPPENITAF